LKSGNHKGYWYLQSSVTKNGIENFEFEVIEICNKQNLLDREKHWIENYKSCNRDFGYNLNPNPNLSPIKVNEVKQKMINSLKEGYKSGRIKTNKTVYKKGQLPWNTGRRYDSTDHLKVPKKRKGSRELFIQTMKNRQLPIDVLDSNNNLIKSFRYIQDVVKDSKNSESEISKKMILHNPSGRNGYLPTQLFNVNINKSIKMNKSYKGLFFKYQTMAYNKQGELLEHPEMDNQQPSLSSNTLEGSTTNSRVQTDNAEDSNANTSALLGYRKSETIITGINFILKDGSEMFVSNDDIV
jgi:group I intron endonuclease